MRTSPPSGDDLLMQRFQGCLLGLAVGDAVGTTVEFQPRGSFPPVEDMTGDGPFHLDAGQWTDDTSMALCLAASLIGRSGFDAHDQMRRYDRWFSEGYFSSTGVCFDIGAATRGALLRFRSSGDPFSGSTDPRSAGNGSLMRLAPVVLAFYPGRDAIRHYAAESSRTTHAAAECLDACRLFADKLWLALSGATKASILQPQGAPWLATPAIQRLAAGDYVAKPRHEIRGSGYVVESLEAALWCFAVTGSYRDAILAAANLGDDADTTAAICGQLAGAFYGLEGIPEHWRQCVHLGREIEQMAQQLARVAHPL